MKILLIEDETDISFFIKKGLEAESCVVDVATDGEEGAALALTESYDAVILDFYLPKLNGIAVAKRIREKKKTLPILVLTVEDDMETKLKMLSLCDDYLTKPFSLKELIARLRAITRRSNGAGGEEVIELGDLCIDSKAFRFMRSGRKIELRNKEFTLLEFFMKNPDVVLSRGVILEHVWDQHADPFTNTVDVHVRLLRKKINDGFKRKLIKTIPKRGYMLEI